MHIAQALMLQVSGMKMTLLYFLVKRDKFFTFKIPNWVNLGKLKRYVSNRARPEGSIAEAYILKECINKWSFYIDGIETVHNRRERNEDFSESSK